MLQKYNPNDYSIENILNFLKMIGEERIIGPHTAKSRHSSVSSVLVNGIHLDNNERADARNLDVEAVIERIKEHYDGHYSPNSLQTHCSHVRCGVNDFIEYNDDPSKFPPGCYQITPARRHRQLNRGNKTPHRPLASPSASQQRMDGATFDVPIPIRGGKKMIIVTGLPMDITKEDASRISATVEALATRQTP